MFKRRRQAGHNPLNALLSAHKKARPKSSTPKFGNRVVIVDSVGRLWSAEQAKRLQIVGVKCDSEGEAKLYITLRDRERRGEICDLRHPHKFALTVNGVKLGELWADFSFVEVATGRRRVQDFKGRHDPSRDVEYRFFLWKCRHVKAEHGVEVEEIRADANSSREQWRQRLTDSS